MSPPLTVAVNLTWMSPGRVGGSEEYLVRQLSGLPQDGSVVVRLFCQPSFADAHPELMARFVVESMPVRRDWRAARIAAEHTWLAAKTRAADLAHHGGGTTPLVGLRPTVVTVHDLQYLAFPSYFSATRRAYLDRMMPRSVRRADVVATPSEYVRRRVLEVFEPDPDHVVVVPHGIPATTAPEERTIESVRKRLAIGDRPFLVYPAITHAHKRHRLLVEMMDGLDPDFVLVLIGGEGAAEADLRRAIESAGLSDRVIRPGRVDGHVRDALLADATALVFPSEYEGFGAPLIEAMSLDTPVVCSDRAAIPEVVGDAAVVVSEASPEAWAAGVAEAIERRTDLVAAGRRQRDRFTLDVSGQALLAAYRQAMRS